jgi:hypothetical protein
VNHLNVRSKSLASPLTTRDFGTDNLDSPLEEVSLPPDDNRARVWAGSRLRGGRARLDAGAAAAELATL